MKFCINCKHHMPSYLNNSFENYDKCEKSEESVVNLVTGSSIKQYRYCSIMRSAGELCDIEAKLFEPKETKWVSIDKEEDEHSPYFPN